MSMHKYKLAALILVSSCLPAMAQNPHAAGAPARRVKVELSAVEYSLPAGQNPAATSALTWSEIENLPAKSVKLLGRVSASGTSGQHLEVDQITNPAKTNTGPGQKQTVRSFAAGESGTILEMEVVTGTDPSFCDANIAYRFRNNADAGNGKPLQEINFTTSFTSLFDTPVVINVSAEPGHEGTFVAVVARVSLVNSGASRIKTK